eukprot:1139511-Pelagomonas_calceolata.AAC.6
MLPGLKGGTYVHLHIRHERLCWIRGSHAPWIEGRHTRTLTHTYFKSDCVGSEAAMLPGLKGGTCTLTHTYVKSGCVGSEAAMLPGLSSWCCRNRKGNKAEFAEPVPSSRNDRFVQDLRQPTP